MMQTPRHIARSIDEDLDSEIGQLELVDWDENHLTLTLVKSLRRTLNNIQESEETKKTLEDTKDLIYPNRYWQIEAYKATSKLEQRHGDIAIVIEDMDVGRVGTGFYEAKAEGQNGKYPAYKMRQLRKLSSATPNLALLLYQRTPKAVVEDDYSLTNKLDCLRSSPLICRSSRTHVIGVNIAKRYSGPELIPDLPQSFGHHFVSRYLTGRDLDYSREPFSAIRNWLAVTKREPPVIVSLRVSRNPSALRESTILTLPDIEPLPAMVEKPEMMRIAQPQGSGGK
jgi:hypothetical protein